MVPTYKRKLLLMHMPIAQYDCLLMLGLGDDVLLLFSVFIAYGGATHLMVDVALTTHSDLGYTNWLGFWYEGWYAKFALFVGSKNCGA